MYLEWYLVLIYFTRNTTSYGINCCLPPPPPLKEGECGYEEYMRRMAAEELIYHEEQAKKQAEWDQVSFEFKTIKRGFAADKPHPSDDTL